MSLLGKILLVMNVLAAVVFVCLAALDRGQRQAWAYAAFRHDLAMQGLPVDEEEAGSDGRPRGRDISDKTRAALFGEFGEPFVTTQVEEVKQLQEMLQKKVDESPSKSVMLARILLPLAATSARREELTKRIRDKVDKSDDLQNDFNALFEDVLRIHAVTKDGKPLEQDGAPVKREPEEWRQAIARLLLNVCEFLREEQEKPETTLVQARAYRRALTVVGLTAAATQRDMQAKALRTLGDDVTAALGRDQAEFVARHRHLIDYNVDLADDVARIRPFVKDQQDLALKEEERVKARRLEVTQKEAELASAHAETKKKLQKQSEQEHRLFLQQQDLRNRGEENQKLEKEIRRLEEGR